MNEKLRKYLYMVEIKVIGPGVYNVEYSPPRWGGNKIKRFKDGEKNQKLEKKKKENF